MKNKWFMESLNGLVVINKNEIILNKDALNHLRDAYKVMIGYDKAEKLLLIKYMSIEDSTLKKYDNYSLHKISFRSGIGKIKGESIINNLNTYLKLDFSNQASYLFLAKWDKLSNTLIVDLKKEADYDFEYN